MIVILILTSFLPGPTLHYLLNHGAVNLTNGPWGVFGFPLSFIIKHHFAYVPLSHMTFGSIALIIDIIFWYLVSCMIFYAYNKLRSVKK